ncbi:nuclear transport factor 2 family protein [Sphaerisporangium sp. NPDC049002]|uniref:nuclear transport factor 2 family protein n=1 Tax=unclassified Sphaerisporangium TaxID=2630420 RepID=UPI0033F0AA1B
MTDNRPANDPADVIEKWFEYFNTYDCARWVECYAEDAVLEDIALQRTFKGREELVEFMRVWVDACPDTRIEKGDVILAGDRAAVPWNGLGTLLGHFPHLPETAVRGSRINNRGLSLMEFAENGLIKRQTDYYDVLAVLRQIGVVQ